MELVEERSGGPRVLVLTVESQVGVPSNGIYREANQCFSQLTDGTHLRMSFLGAKRSHRAVDAVLRSRMAAAELETRVADAELVIVGVGNPADARLIRHVSGLWDGSRSVAVIVNEIWESTIDQYEESLRWIVEHCSWFGTGKRRSASIMGKKFSRTVHYVAESVLDVRLSDDPRLYQITAVGRRHPAQSAWLQSRDPAKTRMVDGLLDRDLALHRESVLGLLGQSEFALCNYPAFDLPLRTRGVATFAYRSVEASSRGAIPVGVLAPPDSPEEDFLVCRAADFSGESLQAAMRSLNLSEWDEVRRQNAARVKHHFLWDHRIMEILVGLDKVHLLRARVSS